MTADETPPPPATEGGPRREVALALAVFLLLVVGVNALGLLARLSDLLLGRFSAWWPPDTLEPLPLAVAGLVILVTAYALATRGSRRRSPGLPRGHRFLPPLDLLLLQLGNVTFTAFALILAVVTCGLLSTALRALVGGPWLPTHGLTASLGAAALVALLSLRRTRPPGSRRALRRRWAKRAATLGGAAGGFWLVDRASPGSLLQIRLADSQLEARTLASLFGLLWLLLAGSAFLMRLERRAGDSPEASSPRRWPGLASLLAWLAYLGFLTLYLNGALLTLRAHLAPG